MELPLIEMNMFEVYECFNLGTSKLVLASDF